MLQYRFQYRVYSQYSILHGRTTYGFFWHSGGQTGEVTKADSQCPGGCCLWEFGVAWEKGPLIDELPIRMVIFHSYMKLPEGNNANPNSVIFERNEKGTKQKWWYSWQLQVLWLITKKKPKVKNCHQQSILIPQLACMYIGLVLNWWWVQPGPSSMVGKSKTLPGTAAPSGNRIFQCSYPIYK